MFLIISILLLFSVLVIAALLGLSFSIEHHFTSLISLGPVGEVRAN